MNIDKIDQIQNVYAAFVTKRSAGRALSTEPDPDLDAAINVVLLCEILRATLAVSGTMTVLIDELRKTTGGSKLFM